MMFVHHLDSKLCPHILKCRPKPAPKPWEPPYLLGWNHIELGQIFKTIQINAVWNNSVCHLGSTWSIQTQTKTYSSISGTIMPNWVTVYSEASKLMQFGTFQSSIVIQNGVQTEIKAAFFTSETTLGNNIQRHPTIWRTDGQTNHFS